MNPSFPTQPGNDDDVRRLLRGLRVDPASADDAAFRQALHRRLAAEAPPTRTRSITFVTAVRGAFARWPGLLWPATGVCSGAVAFALLVVLRGPAVAPAPAVATTTATTPAAPPTAVAQAEIVHRVPTDKTAVIRINFAAEVAVDDVTFDVTLPEGLSFWSKGEKLAMRSFRWQGQLTAGDNPIPIAVRGDRPGRYRVRAAAEVAGARIEHEVVLEVEGA